MSTQFMDCRSSPPPCLSPLLQHIMKNLLSTNYVLRGTIETKNVSRWISNSKIAGCRQLKPLMSSMPLRVSSVFNYVRGLSDCWAEGEITGAEMKAALLGYYHKLASGGAPWCLIFTCTTCTNRVQNPFTISQTCAIAWD